MTDSRPPFPPFNCDTAAQKVQSAEDAWNTRDPTGSAWRTRPTRCGETATLHVVGREEIVAFLTQNGSVSSTMCCARACGLSKATASPSASSTSAMTPTGQWFRSYGNELWEFDPSTG